MQMDIVKGLMTADRIDEGKHKTFGTRNVKVQFGDCEHLLEAWRGVSVFRSLCVGWK